MKHFIQRRRWVLLGVVAALAAGASVGLAAGMVTNDSEEIQACAHKLSGALRMVETPADCNSSEVAVTWNASGPAGPPGPAGTTGPAGPPGPSSAVAIRRDVIADLGPFGEPTTVLELRGLGPGAYAVTAKMRIFSNGGTGHVSCSLLSGRTGEPINFVDGAAALVEISPVRRPMSMLPFAGTVTLFGDFTSLALTCDRAPGGDPGPITTDMATIVAVKVGTEQHT